MSKNNSSDPSSNGSNRENTGDEPLPFERREYLQYTGSLVSILFIGSGITTATKEENDNREKNLSKPNNLRTEYEREPQNLRPDDAPPRFTWQIDAAGRSVTQSAYRVLVSSSHEHLVQDQGDVWDSRRVTSAQSTTVPYDGPTLDPDRTYYWKVRIWDENGNETAWSDPAQFSTALPHTDDQWTGTWIGHTDGNSSPLLRTVANLDKGIKSARAHVATLGYGELHVNGKRIGDEQLNPGWTQYADSVLYSTYDVTDSLQAGENAIGLWLGKGWFSMDETPFYIQWDSYGPPRGLLQLNVTYEDGTTDTVTTNSSWRATGSPIIENHIYNGETYDARREITEWAHPGFNDTNWSAVTELQPPSDNFELRPQRLPPIRKTETLNPVSITKQQDGYLVDFGQNHSGWVELTVRGAATGDEIVIEHGEVLDDDGTLVTANLRTAESTDRYVAKGAGTEVYEPRFTYHGYRYAKITGYPATLTTDDIQSKVVHTDLEQSGSFACSNDDLNQVQHNAVWGLRSNSHSIPTDCPQRDERLGWTGDAHMSIWSEVLNFDAVRFQEKWMDDHEDNQFPQGSQSNTIPMVRRAEDAKQNPEWKDADPNWGKTRVVIPWRMYRHTGDEQLLAKHYDGMKRYVEYWNTQAENHIIPVEKTHYGDWLAFEPWRSDPSLFGTFAHYQTTTAFANIAEVLEIEEDAKMYRNRADAIARAFNDAFFDPVTNQYGSGTQTTYALPLFLGIVPEDHEQAVVENLVEKIRTEDDGKLQTGFVGTRPLIFSLVDYGYEDLAYHVVSQPEAPGWVYMVRNGATTMWERWDSDTQIGSGMNSFNHRPWTLVSEWFYRVLAGINPDESGYRHVGITPVVPDGLDWAEGSVETVRGEVASRWERTDTSGKSRSRDGLVLDVMIPENATGTVRIPTMGSKKVRVREEDKTIWSNGNATRSNYDGIGTVNRDGNAIVVQVGSGKYSFELEQLGKLTTG